MLSCIGIGAGIGEKGVPSAWQGVVGVSSGDRGGVSGRSFDPKRPRSSNVSS